MANIVKNINRINEWKNTLDKHVNEGTQDSEEAEKANNIINNAPKITWRLLQFENQLITIRDQINTLFSTIFGKILKFSPNYDYDIDIRVSLCQSGINPYINLDRSRKLSPPPVPIPNATAPQDQPKANHNANNNNNNNNYTSSLFDKQANREYDACTNDLMIQNLNQSK